MEGFTPCGSIVLLMMFSRWSQLSFVVYRCNIFFAAICCFSRWLFLITALFLNKSSQGPSFLPTGKGSQVAKKNLSNIVAAKTIKVQSVLLMLGAIFSVRWTIFISFCSFLLLSPSAVGLQAGIIVSYGFKIHGGCTECFSAMIRVLTQSILNVFSISGYKNWLLDLEEGKKIKPPKLSV